MVRGLGLGLPGYDADEYLLCPGRTVDGVNEYLLKTVTLINRARMTVFILQQVSTWGSKTIHQQVLFCGKMYSTKF